MSTATTTVADFLLACFAEEEAVARAAIQSTRDGDTDRWRYDGESVSAIPMGSAVAVGPWGGGLSGVGPHIARWDPKRAIDECEAKRRIVERYVKIQGRTQDGDLDERLTLGWVLEQMALPYADHPDFRPEWRP